MPNAAGYRPAPGVPSPSSTRAQVWPEADISVVAFRAHALGGTERQTRALLDHLAAAGVRNVKGYVAGISDADLTKYLQGAERAQKAAECAAGGRRRRGDVRIIRRPRRWPWAVRSDGGGRGV